MDDGGTNGGLGNGGAEEVENENVEDFIQSWTTSISLNTFGIDGELDQILLKELIKFVHWNNLKNDLKDTESLLTKLLGTGRFRKSVFVRAKVYSRLIAVALGLRPAEFLKTHKYGIEYLDPSSWERIRERWGDAQQDGTVLCYLLKDVLEEDDDVMTAIFYSPNVHLTAKAYVPYFDGCELDIVEQISNLWLSWRVLKRFYFDQVIRPITKKVKRAATIPSMKIDRNFIEAKKMLCEHLLKRGVKAGARLLWLITLERYAKPMVGEFLKEMFNPTGDRFMTCFLAIQADYWILGTRGYNASDRVLDGDRQFINVGLRSSHTDYILLCWAARRGYMELIWLVMQTYKPKSKSDLHYDPAKESRSTSAWKCALWCATRHQTMFVIRALSASDWAKDIDLNAYPLGWLPPLHLIALLGDMNTLLWLCESLPNIESGANKNDYLGKTPLDYAMQFMSTTNKIKDHFSKPSQEDRGFESRGRKDVVKKLLHMPAVGERLKELYDMYINQANTVLIGAALIASVAFVGWLQPPLGYTDYFQFTQPNPPAPASTYQSYVAIEGHLSIEMFIVFNTLSFFLAIATMFVGAEATLFTHDKDERTSSLIGMRKSIKWMIGFFISSMLCIMAAFICAGLAILPPIRRLKLSMIVSLSVGAGMCAIPLSWILWSFTENRILVFIKLCIGKERELSPPKDLIGSLVDEADLKRIGDELTNLSESEGDSDESKVEHEDSNQKMDQLAIYLESKESDPEEVTYSKVMSQKSLKMIDKDRDDFISAAEFRDLMINMGEKLSLTDEENDEMFRHINLDGDDQIKCKEFVKTVMAKQRPHLDSAGASNSANIDTLAPASSLQPDAQPEDSNQKKISHSEENYKELYDEYDKDQDGFISAAELRDRYINHLELKLADDEVNEIIREADGNGDGRLNYEEFVTMMTKLMG